MAFPDEVSVGKPSLTTYAAWNPICAVAPMNRFDPPSQARAHAEAHREPSGTREAKPLSLIRVPISMPATRLPPSLASTTIALVRAEVLVRNCSVSAASNGPDTETMACSAESRGEISMDAPLAPVAAKSNANDTPNLTQYATGIVEPPSS